MKGTLYGLGLGPGDPELITAKALRLLRTIPILAWPAPDTGSSFVRSIAAPHLVDLPPRLEIPIRVPMLPNPSPAIKIYDQAAEIIASHLEQGHDVALLCEGDPFFYGSFIYLFQRLAERFPIEVVPGVSSLTAAAAALCMPLATRNQCLSILPAPMGAEALRAGLEHCDVAAIIKLGRYFTMVRTVLEELELLSFARYIAHATLEKQHKQPIKTIDPTQVPYFSMILVQHQKAPENSQDTSFIQKT